jgi:hypothetical protein
MLQRYFIKQPSLNRTAVKNDSLNDSGKKRQHASYRNDNRGDGGLGGGTSYSLLIGLLLFALGSAFMALSVHLANKPDDTQQPMASVAFTAGFLSLGHGVLYAFFGVWLQYLD